MMKKIVIAGLVLAAGIDAASGGEAPRRIASYNLCADQLLLALADPDQIAGLSPYARDASLSAMASEATKYPRLGWDIEYVIDLAPDLVLTGPTDRPTRAMLDASGLRVVEVDLVSNLAQAGQQIRDVARLIGHPDRGEALVQRLRDAEAKLAASALSPPRTASVIERGGYAEGTASLVTAMLTVAGLRPRPGAPGGFGGYMSMETLLTDGPDILVLRDVPTDAGDQGALFITHPALMAKYDPGHRIALASRYSLCGGEALIQGLDALRESVKRLGPGL